MFVFERVCERETEREREREREDVNVELAGFAEQFDIDAEFAVARPAITRCERECVWEKASVCVRERVSV